MKYRLQTILVITYCVTMVLVTLMGLVDMGMEYSMYNKLKKQALASGLNLKTNRQYGVSIERDAANSKAAGGATHADAWYDHNTATLVVGLSIDNYTTTVNLHEMVHAWDHAHAPKGQWYWSAGQYTVKDLVIANRLNHTYAASTSMEHLACFVCDGTDTPLTDKFWAKAGDHPWRTWSKLPEEVRGFCRVVAVLVVGVMLPVLSILVYRRRVR